MIKHWLYSKNETILGPEDAPSMRALARGGKILPDDQINSTLIPLYGWRSAKNEPFIYAECLKLEAESEMKNGNIEKAVQSYKEALMQYSEEGKRMALRMSLLACFKEGYAIMKKDLEETDLEDLEDAEKSLGQLMNFDNLAREQFFDWKLQCTLLISTLCSEDSHYSEDYRRRNDAIEEMIDITKPDWSRTSSKINEQSILLSTLAKETAESAYEKTLDNWLD